MKKIIFAFIFILLFQYPPVFSLPPINRTDANNILIRTNRVIGHAAMSVKRGQTYSGDLAQSVHFERAAKALFIEEKYDKAIFLSRIARIHATDAIKANKVKLPLDASFSALEQSLLSGTPNDEELIKEATLKDTSSLNDKDYINGNLNLELK